MEDLEEPVAYMCQDWKMLGFPAEAILIIMEHLTDQADASRCMRATRKLIAPGEKIVLQYPIRVTQDNLESFCMFIRKDVLEADSSATFLSTLLRSKVGMFKP